MKKGPDWTFSVEQCDVDDKERLQTFRAKAEIWIKALDRDDQNSITTQITEMMWDDAAWRSLNHARFVAKDRDDIGTSGIVGSLLDKGWISGQVIAISRLMEQGAQRPFKQVNSLRRLVDEISENRHLLTREIYIGRDGLPYDYETARSRNPIIVDSDRAQATWLDTSGPNAWHQSILLHEEFDRLSGTAPEKRSRGDLIADALFEQLSRNLEDQVFKDILELRHKSIAHAADELSRSTAKNLRNGISLDEIAKAHYLLIGIYQVVSSNLLYQPWLGTAVPTPQHDQFEGLQKPIVNSDDLGELYRFWREHNRERDEWLNSSYREIIPR